MPRSSWQKETELGEICRRHKILLYIDCIDNSTGCKLQKAYTSLGSSCHDAYTRFQLLSAHAYAFLFLCGVRIECHGTQCVHHETIEMHMHEQATIGIWCTHCGRKNLNWCPHFGVYCQWLVMSYILYHVYEGFLFLCRNWWFFA